MSQTNHSAQTSPFDDIRALLKALPVADEAAEAKTRAREDELVKPLGSLGRLEEISAWVSAWSGKSPPALSTPVVAIFAAESGLGARVAGQSAWPSTAQMMDVIAAGGAGVSVLAQHVGAGLKIFDLAIAQPTPDCTTQDAMTEKDCVATMAFGMEVLAQGHDCLILSDLGRGNDANAAAVAMALYGGQPSDWLPETPVQASEQGNLDGGLCSPASGGAVSRGETEGVTADRETPSDRFAATSPAVAGEDEAQKRLLQTHEGLSTAVARIGPLPQDPLRILSALGGRETAAIAGAILAARLQRVAVILDGYPACVAGAVLRALNPEALDHCLVANTDGSRAHQALLARIGKVPVLDVPIRHSAGAGGAMALNVVKAALVCHAGMATYEQAGLTVPR